HALQETMIPLPAKHVGLIGPLHIDCSFSEMVFRKREKTPAWRGPQYTASQSSSQGLAAGELWRGPTHKRGPRKGVQNVVCDGILCYPVASLPRPSRDRE